MEEAGCSDKQLFIEILKTLYGRSQRNQVIPLNV